VSIICVSIARGRHRHMIAEHKHLVEQGAKLVELRLDYIVRDVNLGRLLGERPCPVIVTCRRERDGGKWSASEEARLMLLRAAIAEGVEYVDLEEDIADRIPRYGATKRIISHHDFRQTPEDLSEVHARLAALDADIVKIATMANRPRDNVQMLKLIRESEVPTVGMCMGEIGTASRILAGKYGAPHSYATFHPERSLAPGQLSYQQMKEIYNYEAIDADTAVYGVIADPIGHSLSPRIHNAAFRESGLNAVYVPFRVPRDHLAEFMADRHELGVAALSVTIPHKEAMLSHLDLADGVVRGIGATNTVVFRDGKTVGYNTDYKAAMESLDRVVANKSEKPLSGRKALVLGAGGVSKTLVFGLIRRGAIVTVASRTRERSEALAKAMSCQAIDWSERHSVKPDVLINGTPLGMHPDVDETPFDAKHLRPGMIVFDTVYNPERTLLIKQARNAGCRVISGLEMFIQQAALQYQYFTDKEAPVDAMREEMKRAIGAARH